MTSNRAPVASSEAIRGSTQRPEIQRDANTTSSRAPTDKVTTLMAINPIGNSHSTNHSSDIAASNNKRTTKRVLRNIAGRLACFTAKSGDVETPQLRAPTNTHRDRLRHTTLRPAPNTPPDTRPPLERRTRPTLMSKLIKIPALQRDAVFCRSLTAAAVKTIVSNINLDRFKYASVRLESGKPIIGSLYFQAHKHHLFRIRLAHESGPALEIYPPNTKEYIIDDELLDTETESLFDTICGHDYNSFCKGFSLNIMYLVTRPPDTHIVRIYSKTSPIFYEWYVDISSLIPLLRLDPSILQNLYTSSVSLGFYRLLQSPLIQSACLQLHSYGKPSYLYCLSDR